MYLNPEEYNPYYKTYIEKMSFDSALWLALKTQGETIYKFYKSVPVDKHNYRYAENKWTVKEILLHIIDAERVFAYRALRIARQDKTALAGFDQDDYVINSNAENRSMTSLLEEYRSVRMASVALFESFSDEALLSIGTASGSSVSVRAIGCIILGHEKHHQQIIEERYL